MLQVVVGLFVAAVLLVLVVRLVKSVARVGFILLVSAGVLALAGWWYSHSGQKPEPVRQVVQPNREVAEPARQAAEPVQQAVQPADAAVDEEVAPVRAAATEVTQRALDAARETGGLSLRLSAEAMEHATEVGLGGADGVDRELGDFADRVGRAVQPAGEAADDAQDAVESK